MYYIKNAVDLPFSYLYNIMKFYAAQWSQSIIQFHALHTEYINLYFEFKIGCRFIRFIIICDSLRSEFISFKMSYLFSMLAIRNMPNWKGIEHTTEKKEERNRMT